MSLKTIDWKTFYYGKLGKVTINCNRNIPKDPSLLTCVYSREINQVEMPYKKVELRLNDYTKKAFITRQIGFKEKNNSISKSEFSDIKKLLNREGYDMVGEGF